MEYINKHFLGIDWTPYLPPIAAFGYADYYRKARKQEALRMKRELRDECPKCGTALTTDYEQIQPAYFSYEDGTIHDDVRKVQLCPACGFTRPAEVEIPFKVER